MRQWAKTVPAGVRSTSGWYSMMPPAMADHRPKLTAPAMPSTAASALIDVA